MRPGRFLVFYCNVGDPINFKMIQCNIDKRSRNQVLHRGVFISRILELSGYNSSLAPKNGSYFHFDKSTGRLEKYSSKHKCIADTPNMIIARGGEEGGVK